MTAASELNNGDTVLNDAENIPATNIPAKPEPLNESITKRGKRWSGFGIRPTLKIIKIS